MNQREFAETLREVGATLTNEQIAKLGHEAQNKFGINKDELMLLLISGKEEFKNYIFKQASKR